MAVRTVTPSATNALNGSLLGELVAIVNELSTAVNALTAKMDTDFADVTNASTDYASSVGTMDTLAYRGGGTPT